MKKLIVSLSLILLSCSEEYTKYKVGETYLTEHGTYTIIQVQEKEKDIVMVGVPFDDSNFDDVAFENNWFWDNTSKVKIDYDSLFLEKHPLYNFEKR